MATAQQCVKDLPPDILAKIAQVLDSRQTPNWRQLIQVMTPSMYRKDHVERFAMETLRPNGSPTYSLLTDLGRRNVTTGELLGWIHKLPDSQQKQSLLQLLTEPPVITRQPTNITIAVGSDAALSCGMSGPGPFQFQWFKRKAALQAQTEAELHLRNVTNHDEGDYVCRVANSRGYVFSEWAKIQVVEEAEGHPSLLGRPIITSHPQNPEVHTVLGGLLRLYCDAMGDPAPTFQWYKDDIPIPDADQREYLKPNMCLDDEGQYVCIASSPSGHVVSKTACVIVMKNPAFPQPVRRGESDQVSDKIALLIGNKDYVHAQHLGVLYHPMNDVCDLAGVLSSIGFKVVSLVNLTLEEMKFALQEFYKLLDKDTYALFYFAGHGFEIHGQSYLMPVNASDRYAPEENMRASQVLEVMQRSSAKLNVVVLDCCRTVPSRPVADESLATMKLKEKNVVIIFGCLPQHPVFECEAERNGYIAKHLLKHIGQHKPVHQVLLDFSKGIDRERIIDPTTFKQQVVHVQTTMVDEMWLTADTSSCYEGAAQASTGTEGWKAAHEIPDSPVSVLEEDGLTVELVFMAEFSNVLLVTARCRPETYHVTCTMPQRVNGCSVQSVTGKEPTIPRQFPRAEAGIRVADLQRLQGNLELRLKVTGENTEKTIVYKMLEKPLYAKIACIN